jgi:glycosyltransferase involved in cell wall biosynthesis
LKQPQVLVVEPPRPDAYALSSGTPYSGSREVRESFLRGLLSHAEIPRIIIVTSRDQVLGWRDVLRRRRVCCDAIAVSIDSLQQLGLGDDVVVTPMQTDLASSIYLRQVMRKPAWPIVGMTHDLSHPSFFNALLLAQTSRIRPGDAIACCSRAAQSALKKLSTHARRLAGLSEERLVFPVIPHGIDLAACRPHDKQDARLKLSLDGNARVFLYFGRINRASKADIAGLIHSFASFNSLGNVCLLIAGSASNRDDVIYVNELKQGSREFGVQERVVFLPNPGRDEKALIYSCADVFVSPADSFQESFGLSLLEAMAYGLPVIASDWNGYRDIVVDGVTGYLIRTSLADDMALRLVELPFCDPSHLHDRLTENVRIDFAAFGSRMEELARDVLLCERLGRAGFQRANQHFAMDGIIRRYCVLWSELADRARSNADWNLGLSPYINYTQVFSDHPTLEKKSRISFDLD